MSRIPHRSTPDLMIYLRVFVRTSDLKNSRAGATTGAQAHKTHPPRLAVGMKLEK